MGDEAGAVRRLQDGEGGRDGEEGGIVNEAVLERRIGQVGWREGWRGWDVALGFQALSTMAKWKGIEKAMA